METVGDKEAPYFIGALLDGDEPQNGELLDFVRVTSLFDSSRSGALYLTASDGEAPLEAAGYARRIRCISASGPGAAAACTQGRKVTGICK